MKNLSLLFIAFLLLPITILAQEGWVQQKSQTINNLNSVYFIDNNNGWVVGDTGTILNTTNSGLDWSFQSSPIITNLRFVQFVDADNGWIIANTSLLRTTDGGRNWVNIADTLSFQCTFFNSVLTGWASSDSIIYKSTDGGLSWSKKFQSNYSPGKFVQIKFLNPSLGCAVQYLWFNQMTFFKTTDGGENWNELQQWVEFVNDFCFVNNNIGWFVQQFNGHPGHHPGEIYKTIDGGNTWLTQLEPKGDLKSVCFIDSITGWIGGSGGNESWPPYNYGDIYSTNNGGVDWINQTKGSTKPINNLLFIDKYNGWAVGDSGIILHTTNGGVTIVEEEKTNDVPIKYLLSQNYPNPFNPTTKLSYSITQSRLVTLKVYDVLGTEIEALVNEEKPIGTYELNWNAAKLSSGVYFYQLKAGEFVETRKMILIK